MARLAKFVVFLGVILLFLGTIAGGFVLILSGGDPISYVSDAYLRYTLSTRADDLAQPAGTDTTEYTVVIPSGSTPTSIAQELLSMQLITDAELFVDYVQAEGLDTQLEAGTYFISQTLTIPEIAMLLTDSSVSTILFRVAEGWRIEQIAEAIDANSRFSFTGADFLAVAGQNAPIEPTLAQELGFPAGASMEGFMFPDTYVLTPNITAVGLVETLFTAFLEQTGNQLQADATANGYTMYQIVTVASIVERESVWDDENALIASVYLNRFEIGMDLQADPTVQYAINGARGSWWPQITLADYRNVLGAHNTYVNNGLPPSPIANPSLSAIQATVYPTESPYFYFRARCDGSNYHNFAETFDEHLQNAC